MKQGLIVDLDTTYDSILQSLYEEALEFVDAFWEDKKLIQEKYNKSGLLGLRVEMRNGVPVIRWFVSQPRRTADGKIAYYRRYIKKGVGPKYDLRSFRTATLWEREEIAFLEGEGRTLGPIARIRKDILKIVALRKASRILLKDLLERIDA